MLLFRKKPVVIEAVQWIGENIDALKEFVPKASMPSWNPLEKKLFIATKEGEVTEGREGRILSVQAGYFHTDLRAGGVA